MSSDPAIVNVPLAKRGNINAQLDAYRRQTLADVIAADKARQAAYREAYGECCTIIDGLSDERLAVLGAKHSLTPIQTRAELKKFASRYPAQSLVALRKEAV